MTRPCRSLVVALFVAISLGGCNGVIKDAGDRPGPTPSPEDPILPVATPSPSGPSAATPTRFWRLSWEEYDGALSELAGRPLQPSVDAGFPPETEALAGWLNVSASLEAGGALASAFETAALDVAPEIASGLPRCDAGDRACATTMVNDLGERAWRRPLTAEEVARYVDLFAAAAAADDEATATNLVVETMVRSPYFLFRSEVGDPATVTSSGEVLLTPHELASALSFGLWRAPPDARLRSLAEEGTLLEPAVYAAEARRMVDDARFSEAFHEFITQWLGTYDVAELTKDASAFPELNSATGPAMEEETRAFIDDILRNEGASFARLMTADHTFPPADIGWIYGQTTDGSRISNESRSGLLNQPSFAATHAGASWTSPTARGVFVVERVACFHPPPPDESVIGTIPDPGPGQTTRQAFEAHRSDPACAGCHGFFDPVGMTFEAFDATGRFRTTENGQPIDPSGVLWPGVLGPDEVPLADSRALGQALAESERVHQCLTTRAFQYFLGRAESSEDQPLLDEAYQAFVTSELDMRELILAFFESDRFRWRQATP